MQQNDSDTVPCDYYARLALQTIAYATCMPRSENTCMADLTNFKCKSKTAQNKTTMKTVRLNV